MQVPAPANRGSLLFGEATVGESAAWQNMKSGTATSMVLPVAIRSSCYEAIVATSALDSPYAESEMEY